jgi:hypothetical protein
MSGEIMDQVSGNEYRVAAAAKRTFDPEVEFHVKWDAATVAYADISTINWLRGTVTFTSPPTGSVLWTGSYFPLTTSNEVQAEVVSFDSEEVSDLIDSTVFKETPTGFRKREPGLKELSMSMELYLTDSSLTQLKTVYDAGVLTVIQIFFSTTQFNSLFAYARLENVKKSDTVDGLVSVSVSLKTSSSTNPSGPKFAVPGYIWSV